MSHCFIGVLALEQLIVEMGYATKGRTLIQTRRISISFRDKSLLELFKLALTLVRELHLKLSAATQMGPKEELSLMADVMLHALRLAHKAMTFEFSGVLLDETIEDSNTVQFPLTWRDTMQDEKT